MNIENFVNNFRVQKKWIVTTDVKKQLRILVVSGQINEAKFFS
jgi:hypothetical protein